MSEKTVRLKSDDAVLFKRFCSAHADGNGFPYGSWLVAEPLGGFVTRLVFDFRGNVRSNDADRGKQDS